MNLERLKLIALNVPDLTLCTEPVSLVMIPSTNQLLVQLNHSPRSNITPCYHAKLTNIISRLWNLFWWLQAGPDHTLVWWHA